LVSFRQLIIATKMAINTTNNNSASGANSIHNNINNNNNNNFIGNSNGNTIGQFNKPHHLTNQPMKSLGKFKKHK